MGNSYTQYFRNAFGDSGQINYMRAHYDVSGCFHGKDKLNTNLLSRIINALVKITNDQVTFPKAVVVITEQEFIDSLKHYKPGFSTLVGRVIEHLFNQVHRIIIAHKEKLPSKARKFKFPMVLWATMPEHYDWRHMNEYRKKFNDALRATASLFREMSILPLNWDDYDCDRANVHTQKTQL